MIIPENNIGIIGCGKMGKDLFNYLTGFPFTTILVCKTEISVEQQKKDFIKKQNRALKYGLIDQETYIYRGANTYFTTDLNRLKEADLIIESISEDVDLKRRLFEQLQKVITSDCIVASNSSSIPPVILFEGILEEERSLGIHFFYPIAHKDIIEVNLGEMTSEKTISIVDDFLKKINKFHIMLSHEHHFIINRMFLKMQAGCCQLLDSGVASVAETDGLIKSKLFPIGVFEFFDHVGNDVMLESVRNYLKYESNPEFYQQLLNVLEQKVKRGEFGMKTNSGFYEYPKKGNGKIVTPVNPVKLVEKIAFWYLEGVFDAHLNAGLSKMELDHIVEEYLSVEKSPFVLAKEIGYTPK